MQNQHNMYLRTCCIFCKRTQKPKKYNFHQNFIWQNITPQKVLTNMYLPALLQRTLKNYALWKKFSKCIKFGTKSTHFQKNFFLSKCVNMGHINPKKFKQTCIYQHCYNALWKNLNLGPSQPTFKKNIFYQSALTWGILTHFEKITPNIIFCMAGSISLLLSNIIINFENASISSNMLLTILSIVHSFVMGLKKYCWDKSGFASCKLNFFFSKC